MQGSPSIRAFSVMELVVAMAIVTILMALYIVLMRPMNLAQKRAQAVGDITALIAACNAYKTDQGGYPQDNSPSGTSATDTLDPRIHFNAATPAYAAANLFLYVELTGDTNANGKIDAGETARKYAGDFFKASRYDSGFAGSGKISYIKDPFGNAYGYSTAGLKAEQNYRVLLQSNPNAARTAPPSGYNATFDLWSTGGSKATSSVDQPKWFKNW